MASLLQVYIQVEDANGLPRSGAKAYTYTVGTTTPLTTYSDYGLTTPHANPIVADSEGVFAPAYVPSIDDVKVVLKTSADVTLRTFERIPVTFATGAASVDTAAIVDNAVDNAKLANMVTQRIKGRDTAGTGDPEDLTPTLAMLMVLSALATPTSGFALNAAGAGVLPTWANNGIRAHCCFDGTGTPAFKGTPYNFASITDNSTGSYTVNFSSALPSANYTAVVTLGPTGNNVVWCTITNKTVNGFDINIGAANDGASLVTLQADSPDINVIVVGG